MADATPELIFATEKFAPDFLVFVIEEAGLYWGFCSLIPTAENTIELHDLFVDPGRFGMGVGRLLWEHAVDTARTLGYRKITLTADPHAEAFYARCGASTVGWLESTLRSGRKLPRMEYVIPAQPLSATQ